MRIRKAGVQAWAAHRGGRKSTQAGHWAPWPRPQQARGARTPAPLQPAALGAATRLSGGRQAAHERVHVAQQVLPQGGEKRVVADEPTCQRSAACACRARPCRAAGPAAAWVCSPAWQRGAQPTAAVQALPHPAVHALPRPTRRCSMARPRAQAHHWSLATWQPTHPRLLCTPLLTHPCSTHLELLKGQAALQPLDVPGGRGCGGPGSRAGVGAAPDRQARRGPCACIPASTPRGRQGGGREQAAARTWSSGRAWWRRPTRPWQPSPARPPPAWRPARPSAGTPS